MPTIKSCQQACRQAGGGNELCLWGSAGLFSPRVQLHKEARVSGRITLLLPEDWLKIIMKKETIINNRGFSVL